MCCLTCTKAKSHHIGEHAPVAPDRGAGPPLRDRRTQINIKSVYVSIGDRISLNTAIALTLELAPRYRLPETTRQADR